MASAYPCVDTKSPRWTDKPVRAHDRDLVLTKCGRKCFLFPDGTPSDPGRPHYPICVKCKSGRCRCCLSCTGLQAVYRRLTMAIPKYRGEMRRQAEAKKEQVVRMALQHATPTNACKWAISAAKTMAAARASTPRRR